MKKDATALVEEFADSVIKQSRAIRSGTTKQAKYYGNKRAPIARKLLGMGDAALRQFATLLHHPVREIRGTAAVYLMSSVPEEVTRGVQGASRGRRFRGHVRTTAHQGVGGASRALRREQLGLTTPANTHLDNLISSVPTA